jgi:RNA polymerase sigma-70 factor (ECF subfamily)
VSEEQVNTIQLNAWVDRMRAGDLAARDELLHSVCDRLERLARKMLRKYPSVQRWAETGDVLQSSLLRLLRALEQVRPGSVREFFGLAAEQMRRELLDLARRYHGPRGIAANHDSVGPDAPVPDAAAPGDDAAEMRRWTVFHEEVERLPAEEREVVALVFYHGWTQVQVSELFQTSVRTVQRRWESAMVTLRAAMRGDEPA